VKYIYYYIWIILASLHPVVSKVFSPINWVIIKMTKKSDEDYKRWKRTYNKANLDFPGGINDWFAFGFMLALIYVILLALLFCFDKYTMFFLKSDILFVGTIIGIAAFCYYWIYFRNIDWLKKRINKINKKYYIK
jgi:hypothetical protein